MQLKNVEDPIKVYEVLEFPKYKTVERRSSNFFKYSVAAIVSLVVIAVAAYFSLSNEGTTENPDEVIDELSEDERFAVLPFDNRTNNPELSSLGKMISDWTTELVFESGRQIVSPKTVEQNIEFAGILPSNPSGKASFNEMTGATKIIEGEYYLVQDNIRVTARLIDAQDGNVLFQFDEITGSQENIEKVVQDFSQIIAGYLATERSVNLGLFAPPKYEAYRVYQEALNSTSDQQYREGISKALQIDSTFSAPYRDVFTLFEGDAEKAYQTLRRHKTQLTRFESLLFQFWRTQNWNQSLSILSELYEMDPYDPETRMSYISGLLRDGRPRSALRILEQNPVEISNIDTSQFYQINYFETYLDANRQLGNHAKVMETIYEVPFNKRSKELVQFSCRVLVRLNKLNEVELLLDSMKNLRPSDLSEDFEAGLFQATGLELLLLGQEEEASLYLGEALEYDDYFSQGSTAYSKLMLGDARGAEAIYEDMLADDSLMQSMMDPPMFDPNIFYLGRLGVAKAMLGKTEEAQKIIKDLLQENIVDAKSLIDKARLSSFNYYQASQIYAHLDNPDKAMELLQTADHYGGIPHVGYGMLSSYLVWDPLLLVLKDYEPYLEFCKPKDVDLEIN
jgi:tetratricopeptide (TPR) repeat protein/TolB-like protein